jgi:hypothetical protein
MAGEVSFIDLLKHEINSDQKYQYFLTNYLESSMENFKHLPQ